MAATLTRDQEELTFFSFPIEKQEDTETVSPVDGTPDIWIWGKATDGTVDGDREIVDPAWSALALRQWADTGANVRMSHDPKRPVGKGHEVQVTTDGHYVKSLICDPLAKHLIRNQVLNDYSVGLSNPDFRYGDRKLDPEGKALRVITGKPDGSSRVVELSVVDRGSNFNSRFQVVRKSAGDGFELIGQMVGDEDEIAKAAPAHLTKAASDTVNVDVPRNASITFSPADLAKLLDHRERAEQRQKRDFDRNVGGGVDRDKIPDEDFAGKNRSFPIVTAGDVSDALQSIGRAGADNYDGATLRANILRIAKRKGFPVPDGDSEKAAKCGTCHGSGKIMDGNRDCPDCDGPAKDDAGKATAPDVAKDDSDEEGDEGGSESEGGALHHDDGQDDDTDSDADAMDKAATPDMTKPPKVPCPKCSAKMKAKAKFCGKCGASMTAEKASKPTPADHAEGAAEAAIQPAPEHREPDGPVVEAFEHDAGLPTVPDADVMQRVAAHHKSIGVPYDAGWLHDLLCPAFDPATAKAAHPLADLGMLDELAWQAKALDTAARAPLDQAREAALLWQHALTVKAIPPHLADELLLESHKAFRDANPGPGKAPVPGEIRAERYHRPYITDGHAAPSPGQDAPHRDPVHAGHVSASMYHRGPLTDGQAEDSPGNANPRPEPIPAPEVPGVPSRVYYTRMQRDNARQAMGAMHDHIARTFPDVCPMLGPGHMGEPGAGTRPVPVGVGGPVPHGASKADGDAIGSSDTAETVPITRITPKQLRRRLEKAVLAGEIGIDAARVQLGLQPFGGPLGEVFTAEPAALKAATGLIGTVDPEIIKTAVAEAIGPLIAQRDAGHAEELASVRKELKGLRKVADAIADQPDPNVTAYRGVALAGPAAQKTSPSQAGGAMMADRAERAQATLFNAMYETWRTASNPEDREIAFDAMKDMTGLNFRNPMT